MTGSVAELVKQQAIEILEEKADMAVSIMQGYASTGEFATGKLASTIHKEVESEFSRLVGTSTSVVEYAKYANDGRGDVYPNPGSPPFDHPLYLKGLNIWRYHAGPAKGKHFVEKTAKALK